MLNSFNKWESEDSKERQNAGLRELELLTNLTCLEIDIKDHALVVETLHLPSKIERFYIRISASLDMMILSGNKKMHLRLEEGTCLGHWIEKLLRDTEHLVLIGSGANKLGLLKFQHIQRLILEECETMKNVVTTSTDDHGRSGATLFPVLEYLDLFSLLRLEEIWDGAISSNSFLNLKRLQLGELLALKQLWKGDYVSLFTNLSFISIFRCPLLQNLGQLSIAGKDCLSQLESLRIHECEAMEQVFLWNEDSKSKNHHVTKIFPKLKNIELYNLPNLTTFYQGIEEIEFPLLTRMDSKKCPKMRSIITPITTTSSGIRSNLSNLEDTSNVDHHSSHLFCQPEKVSFGCSLKIINTTDLNPFCRHDIPVSLYNGLEVFSISEYHDSMSLFSSSIAVNLVSLTKLSIKRCDEMVRVIKDDEEKAESGGERTPLFPKLQQLKLRHLRSLVSFCEWECDIELPSLTEVFIEACPDMKSFTVGSSTTPNLGKIEIETKDFGVTKGIDGALQEHLAGEKERDEEVQEKEESNS